MQDFLITFLNIVKIIQIKDILDTFLFSTILSIIVYIFLQTKSYKLISGILILVIIYLISQWFNLTIARFLLEEIFKLLPIVLIIIFSKEIKLFFAKIGIPFTAFKLKTSQLNENTNPTQEILDFLEAAKKLKLGAILVFENDNLLDPIIENKIKINADLSKELLLNIFQENSLLHDGAVIINKEKIKYASAILPLSNKEEIWSVHHGTRHRAGLGITEETDALALIVSEKNGAISLANKGEIIFDVDLNKVEEVLKKYYSLKNDFEEKLKINLVRILKFITIFLPIFSLTMVYLVVTNHNKAKIQKFIQASVEFRNLNENLFVTNIKPEFFKITLSGYETDLKNLNENKVKIVIDIKNEDIGKYFINLSPQNIINVPPKVDIINIDPNYIKFEIKPKPKFKNDKN